MLISGKTTQAREQRLSVCSVKHNMQSYRELSLSNAGQGRSIPPSVTAVMPPDAKEVQHNSLVQDFCLNEIARHSRCGDALDASNFQSIQVAEGVHMPMPKRRSIVQERAASLVPRQSSPLHAVGQDLSAFSPNGFQDFLRHHFRSFNRRHIRAWSCRAGPSLDRLPLVLAD